MIAHADWSVHPNKRWLAKAILGPGGRYMAHVPEPVGPLEDLLPRLAGQAGGGPVMLGFDFPIGLPLAYAERAGIQAFVPALLEFGSGRWRHFWEPAERPEEISLERPFYPRRPGARGQTARRHLAEALGLADGAALLRECERRTPTRNAACPLFWTLGGQQVGRAAISGWRDLLAPALRAGVDLAIWPFQRPLHAMLAEHQFIVAETYPGEMYAHLGLELRPLGGKRWQAARMANAARLLGWAHGRGVGLAPALRAAIEEGFGPSSDGEDRFDAVVGLFAMLEVVLGERPTGEPKDPRILRAEGWILGQAFAAELSAGALPGPRRSPD